MCTIFWPSHIPKILLLNHETIHPSSSEEIKKEEAEVLNVESKVKLHNKKDISYACLCWYFDICVFGVDIWVFCGWKFIRTFVTGDQHWPPIQHPPHRSKDIFEGIYIIEEHQKICSYLPKHNASSDQLQQGCYVVQFHYPPPNPPKSSTNGIHWTAVRSVNLP